MPFVVVTFRGEEVTRRELTGPMVIGRAPECDVAVRDIILSRRHCRITPADGAHWAVEDLGSKNGTRIGGEPVQYAILNDGTSVRIGKTQVRFYTGSLKPAPVAKKGSSARRRPADPFEALSGTVADFEYVPEHPVRDLSRLPTPRPQPSDPASYSREDVYTMLTEIASSSWDSIYATASGPAAVMVAGQTKKLSAPGMKVAGTDLPPRRRHVLTDPSLQVDHTDPADTAATVDLAPSASIDLSMLSTSEVIPPPPLAARKGRWLAPVGSVLRGVKHVLTGRFLRRAS